MFVTEMLLDTKVVMKMLMVEPALMVLQIMQSIYPMLKENQSKIESEQWKYVEAVHYAVSNHDLNGAIHRLMQIAPNPCFYTKKASLKLAAQFAELSRPLNMNTVQLIVGEGVKFGIAQFVYMKGRFCTTKQEQVEYTITAAKQGYLDAMFDLRSMQVPFDLIALVHKQSEYNIKHQLILAQQYCLNQHCANACMALDQILNCETAAHAMEMSNIYFKCRQFKKHMEWNYVAVHFNHCNRDMHVNTCNQQRVTDAHQYYMALATKGNSMALFVLGMLYWNGDGVAVNCAIAVEMFQCAATVLPDAMYMMGVAHLYGRGVSCANASKAKEWLQKAEKQNYSLAREKLLECQMLLLKV